MLDQLHGYSFTIQNNIDNNLYHGQQLSQANAIQASVESLIEDINSAHRSGLEEKILGRVVVQLQGAEDHHFDGGDAHTLWKLFDGDKDFRDED